ncbi:MAG: hypothetical protein J3K34DRAFT_193856 [Monoraphidium minutum]|nr:MAG: hypothetical protein J3K34DRAFT_193856 [Monoraphidium minutum]
MRNLRTAALACTFSNPKPRLYVQKHIAGRAALLRAPTTAPWPAPAAALREARGAPICEGRGAGQRPGAPQAPMPAVVCETHRVLTRPHLPRQGLWPHRRAPPPPPRVYGIPSRAAQPFGRPTLWQTAHMRAACRGYPPAARPRAPCAPSTSPPNAPRAARPPPTPLASALGTRRRPPARAAPPGPQNWRSLAESPNPAPANRQRVRFPGTPRLRASTPHARALAPRCTPQARRPPPSFSPLHLSLWRGHRGNGDTLRGIPPSPQPLTLPHPTHPLCPADAPPPTPRDTRHTIGTPPASLGRPTRGRRARPHFRPLASRLRLLKHTRRPSWRARPRPQASPHPPAGATAGRRAGRAAASLRPPSPPSPSQPAPPGHAQGAPAARCHSPLRRP